MNKLSINNVTLQDIAEMWVTDHDKYRQVVPAETLVIDVNPYSLPVA